MGLAIIAPGFRTSLLSDREPGSRHLGWPLGGPADRANYLLAQALVGNTAAALACEFTLIGPTLQAEHPIAVAIVGQGFLPTVNGMAVEPNHSFQLEAGDVLQVGGSREACRGYLTVAGGFTSEADKLLSVTDRLACPASRMRPRTLAQWPSWCQMADTVRVLPGPQQHLIEVEPLYHTKWRVSTNSNRMGLRLEGTAIPLSPFEMLSEPVIPGTIQLTHQGLPILLGVDGQTIGGYAKVGYVVQADLDQLGRWQPGQSVHFEPSNMEQATALVEQRQQELQHFVSSLLLSAQLDWL